MPEHRLRVEHVFDFWISDRAYALHAVTGGRSLSFHYTNFAVCKQGRNFERISAERRGGDKGLDGVHNFARRAALQVEPVNRRHTPEPGVLMADKAMGFDFDGADRFGE